MPSTFHHPFHSLSQLQFCIWSTIVFGDSNYTQANLKNQSQGISTKRSKKPLAVCFLTKQNLISYLPFLQSFGILKHLMMSEFLNSSSHHNNGGDEDKTSRASSSSTPPPPPPLPGHPHEVFLSFRGETRHGFTDHLYERLKNAGISVFRDKEGLPVGERNWPELLKAIENSKILIPIISPDYAASEWCLNELVHILKCKKKFNQLVVPIFCRVKPSDVREKLNVSQGDSQVWKKRRLDFDGTHVQEWKDALMEVSWMTGLESEKIADGYEGRLLGIVVAEVLKALKKPSLALSDELVGVEHHVEKILNMVNVEGSNDVRAILIHGMGGIGKTTLAKVIYNRLTHLFDCYSFIADIRETWSQHKGKVDLQKQLISNILGAKQSISSVDEGVQIIRDRFKRKKALILLDDADHRDQLNALAGKRDWFGRGSILIITSRKNDVLKEWEGSFNYQLDGLNDGESFLLFCKHAFKESHSISNEFHTLAERIVSTTGGLPLAIEVIGRHLRGEDDIDTWEKILKKLKEIPDDEVQRKLKISFDILKSEEREIFLDIACLPIGKNRKFAIYMWESCGFHPELAIKKLESMSLIKIGERGELTIHDQLRDLGREIVREEDINNPGKRSRLWKSEDAEEVLELQQGTSNIQALCLHNNSNRSVKFTGKQFEGMTNMKFLEISYVCLEGDFKKLFLNLRWISINGDIKDINFSPKKLVILQLYWSRISENWDGWRHVQNLKVLELHGNNCLTLSPDFSAMKQLEVLKLSWCQALEEIHPSIGELSETLKVLNVCGCSQLTKLPMEVGIMKKLRELRVDWTGIREIPISKGYMTNLEILSTIDCIYLTNVPDSLSSLLSLQQLNLRGCSSLTNVPDSLGSLLGLQQLDLRGCSSLTNIPDSLGSLPGLQGLDLRGCSSLTNIPNSLGSLHSLQQLDLRGCSSLTNVPDSLGSLLGLQQLDLRGCSSLTNVPDSLGSLLSLQQLDLRGCSSLTNVPDSLGSLLNLKELYLSGCSSLTNVPDSFGSLLSLQQLDLRGCSSLTNVPYSLGSLLNLKQLYLSGCSSLTNVPNSFGSLLSLQKLFLRGCSSLTSVPDSLGSLLSLQQLDLRGCSSLTNVPYSLGSLLSLQELDLSRCSSLTNIPDSLGSLLSLPQLDLSGCSSLTNVPDSLGLLLSLQQLDLSECSSLTNVPDSLGSLLSLQQVDLSGCSSLTNVPDSLGSLLSLQRLDLSRCSSLTNVPDSLGSLLSLQQLDLRGCSSLTNVPDSLGSLLSLQQLDLSGCSLLTNVPDSLGSLLSLQRLDLSGCSSLTNVPDSLGSLLSRSWT